MIEHRKFTLVIDCGPDFRQQMLREQVKKLDAILMTHSHKDHLAGLDDIRAFNYFQKKPMNVYASTEVEEAIRHEFFYAFDPANRYPWLPKVTLHNISPEKFSIDKLKVVPIQVMHGNLPVLGFRFGDFTYITDASFIAEEELEKIAGTKILVLNALRKEKHISHFSLQEAIDVAEKAGVGQTYFTHISHQMGLHEEVSSELPPNFFLAYDGLKMEV